MSHTERLRRSPQAFRQLTGITPPVFDQLPADLTPHYDQAEARRKDRPDRQRRPGAGRKHALDLADRLLMLLIYYRTYTTHAVLGFLFGVDDSAVGRNINPLQPLLAGLFRIPERRVAMGPEGLGGLFFDAPQRPSPRPTRGQRRGLTGGKKRDLGELFFDATERPIPRPTRGQRRFYSGKKKRHTVKTQVVVTRRRKPPGPGAKPRRVRIAAVSRTFAGKTHDKKVYDRTRVVSP